MEEILNLLPYDQPFLFVDGLSELSETEVKGYYTFTEKSDFYRGHFRDNPITPGVLLTECMAQIGLVCLGIYLLKQQNPERLKDQALQVAFTEAQVQFLKAVLPNTKVWVHSKRLLWRMGKLKCTVEMRNEADELIARGELSGMIK